MAICKDLPACQGGRVWLSPLRTYEVPDGQRRQMYPVAARTGRRSSGNLKAAEASYDVGASQLRTRRDAQTWLSVLAVA